MLVEDRTMPIRPRPDFSKTVARAGIERRELADAAQLSKRAIDRLAKPANYGEKDKGTTRELTAWRIARAFGERTGQTAEAAFEQLFIEEED